MAKTTVTGSSRGSPIGSDSTTGRRHASARISRSHGRRRGRSRLGLATPLAPSAHGLMEEGNTMALDSGTFSAVSALAGSAIGALALVLTSWFTQHSQGKAQRLNQEASRRERLFSDFVDQASKTYADGIIQESLNDPEKLVPMYAAINKLRLFATRDTIAAAEAVMNGILKTYDAPVLALGPAETNVDAHDILREFAESCRAELEELR